MAKAFIEEDTLTAIGDAIRSKGNTTELLKPSEMAGAIRSMVIGEQVIPDEAFENYNDNSYRFYKGNHTWLIKNHPDLFIEPLRLGAYMFYECGYHLRELPCKIIISNRNNLSYAFYGCHYLTEIDAYPELWLSTNNTYNIDMDNMFNGCTNLNSLPEDIFANDEAPYTSRGLYSGKRNGIFTSCSSLRKLPNLEPLATDAVHSEDSLYLNLAFNCWALDGITNLPVCSGAYWGNAFSGIVDDCFRLKDFTFAVNVDGTPIKAQWAYQIIDLGRNIAVGYVPQGYEDMCILSYSDYSGITGTTLIEDGADYFRYKNNANSWTNQLAYSRYNKASAVATINSLPDTSEYLAEQEDGATNTIIFKGLSGNYTDAGPINSLTEEEIAVATAKGWTVAIS